MPRVVTATRYVTPLREGGSLPGLIEADDDGLYVVKFRGAGQGVRALIAELVARQLAVALGLPVPELVLVELDAELGRAEPDSEVRALIIASDGLNVGLDFLPGALDFSAGGAVPVAADFAADVVWFDALVTNVDRTPRNPNMLFWHRRTWLIDHGAALYLHHGTKPFAERAREPFPLIREHVLLPVAASIADADARLAPLLSERVIEEILHTVPASWLVGDPAAARRRYVEYLVRRLQAPRGFVQEAQDARGA